MKSPWTNEGAPGHRKGYNFFINEKFLENKRYNEKIGVFEIKKFLFINRLHGWMCL